MKKIIKTFCVGLVIGGAFLTAGAEEASATKIEPTKDQVREIFYQQALTYSWVSATAALQGSKGDKLLEESWRRMMVSKAFDYWLVVERGIVARLPVHERQFRDAIKNGVIPRTYFDDPLGRQREQFRFGNSGKYVMDSEYGEMVNEFLKIIDFREPGEK